MNNLDTILYQAYEHTYFIHRGQCEYTLSQYQALLKEETSHFKFCELINVLEYYRSEIEDLCYVYEDCKEELRILFTLQSFFNLNEEEIKEVCTL